MISRRTLKLMAIGYAVKTVAFAVAWLIVPDLPQRTLDTARQAWVWASASVLPQPGTLPPATGSVTAR